MLDQKEQPETPPQQQVTSLDMMIAKFQLWVEKVEKLDAEARAKAAERAHIPDDVPRFVTRYP